MKFVQKNKYKRGNRDEDENHTKREKDKISFIDGKERCIKDCITLFYTDVHHILGEF